MKTRTKILIPIIAVIAAVILFVPIPSGKYKDGGSREFTALTYKIVSWNRITASGNVYDHAKIYFFPYNFKSIDSLWEKESQTAAFKENEEHKFIAKILEINSSSALVSPIDEYIKSTSTKISFNITSLEDIEAKVGDHVEIAYTGNIMETYPAQITATSWKKYHSQLVECE